MRNFVLFPSKLLLSLSGGDEHQKLLKRLIIIERDTQVNESLESCVNIASRGFHNVLVFYLTLQLIRDTFRMSCCYHTPPLSRSVCMDLKLVVF